MPDETSAHARKATPDAEVISHLSGANRRAARDHVSAVQKVMSERRVGNSGLRGLGRAKAGDVLGAGTYIHERRVYILYSVYI